MDQFLLWSLLLSSNYNNLLQWEESMAMWRRWRDGDDDSDDSGDGGSDDDV